MTSARSVAEAAEVVLSRITPGWGGCWLFTGEPNKDRPRIATQHGPLRAYRVIALHLWGPIAPGLSVNHRCDQPRCVRPDHLYIGTQAENNRDALERGRHVSGFALYRARNGRSTSHECGHDDWYVSKGGRRQCRPCHLARQRRYAAARAAAKAAS